MNFSTKYIPFLYLFTLLAGTLFFIPAIFVNRFLTVPALWIQVGIAVGTLGFVVKRNYILLPPREFLVILLLWLIYYLWRGGVNIETIVSVATYYLALLLFFQILIYKSNKEKLFLVATIITVVLCAWCAGQLLGWLPRYNNQFSITGPFDNPAGISASLAILLPFVLYGVERNKKWVRLIYAIIATAVIISIILSQARAAVIAAVIIIFVFGIRWIKSTTKFKFYTFHYFLVLLVLISLFGCLYLLKKDSANGRLLIWRCSGELVIQKPLFGHGANGFIANYMDQQANYFTKHPDSKYAMLADNIRHPFNEYLKSIVEYGIVGFFLIVLLFFYPLYYSRKTLSKESSTIRLSLTAIAICAMCSYPLNYPFVGLMTILLFTFLLTYDNEKRISISNNFVIKSIILLFSLGLLSATAYQAFYQREWYKTAHQSLRGETDQMLAQYKKLYIHLHRNELFLYNYAAELNVARHYEESQQISQECDNIWADYDLQMLMADNCLKLQQYKEAERHLKKAVAMCPVKFMPLYRLTELYLETGRKDEALELAKKIVSKQEKIPSPVINSIKNKMRKLLNEQLACSEKNKEN